MQRIAARIFLRIIVSTESLLSISFTSSLARYAGDVIAAAVTTVTFFIQFRKLLAKEPSKT